MSGEDLYLFRMWCENGSVLISFRCGYCDDFFELESDRFRCKCGSVEVITLADVAYERIFIKERMGYAYEDKDLRNVIVHIFAVLMESYYSVMRGRRRNDIKQEC